MTVKVNDTAFVASGVQTIGVSAMFTVATAASNPTYLVLTALDRDEYTAGATTATGHFTGNGQVASFTNIGSDGRGAGIVFTYQASSGRYYSAAYGYFDQLQYSSSASIGDVTNISVFGTSSLTVADAYADDPYALMQMDSAGYLGSVTVATQSAAPTTIPLQATPMSIAAVADTFVGDAWNSNGCWVLASTIAAEAGASLPVQSTAIDQAGQANGEWIVAFNGPAGQSGNWQSMITAGEMVVFATPGGGGHITTIVSGSGTSAMVVDNVTYENILGQITNPANDGSADDVTIAAPHAASEEWSGVAADSVVIYELDTPVVTDKLAVDSVAAQGMQTLSSLFSAADPANKAIASYQIYDLAPSDGFAVSGVNQAAHSAATALTITSLTSAAYVAGASSGTDTIEIRAFNGSYWGDWQALSVTVTAATPLAAPVVSAQTSSQIWTQGQHVSFTLAANTFTDPQGQALTYSAALASGQALPGWLSFNAATRTFTGTVPAAMQTLSIAVTAKDTSGLSATERFSAIVGAAPPLVAAPTSGQIWPAGQKVSFALPAGTFTDPQGETLTYSAAQTNGQALPSWLSFNAATDSFSGTAPITAQTLGLTVTATDTSGLSVADSFSVSIAPAHPTVANQTPDLHEIDGKAFSFALPANTFADAAAGQLSYLAYQIGGASVTSWLHFNGSTQTLSGTPPLSGSGTARIEIVASDSARQSAVETFNLIYARA